MNVEHAAWVVLALSALSPRAADAQAINELPESIRGPIQLRVEGPPSLALHARPSWARREWARLCDAPCAIDLVAGTYALGVSEGAGQPALARAIDLSRPRRIHIDYESRADARNTGQSILQVAAVPIAIGIAGFLTWALVNGAAAEISGGAGGATLLPELLGPSLGVLALGGIIALFAIPFSSQSDLARVTEITFE